MSPTTYHTTINALRLALQDQAIRGETRTECLRALEMLLEEDTRKG